MRAHMPDAYARRIWPDESGKQNTRLGHNSVYQVCTCREQYIRHHDLYLHQFVLVAATPSPTLARAAINGSEIDMIETGRIRASWDNFDIIK